MATGCRVRRRISICRSSRCLRLANAPYVHDPESNWLYIVGRVKPGVALGSAAGEVERAAAADTGAD